MAKLKIAVIGAGIGGLAACAFLKRSCHDVTLYEKFTAPKPIGAGLLLQPTGLAVLARLGLDRQIIERSCPIHALDGKIAGSGKLIFGISYHSIAPHIFGLGTYRNTLFEALHSEVLRQQVPVMTSIDIDNLSYNAHGLPHVMADDRSFGPYDLVIDAEGMNSKLRNKFADVRLNKPYPYAAIWGICRDVDGRFDQNALIQRYQAASHMIGVMPVGRLNGDTCQSIAFFWSMRAKDHDAWLQMPLDEWKKQVTDLWPETDILLAQFQKHADLTFATYRDVILKQWHGKRLAFIGDAAHCGSPQLGQGANMALIDAMVLDECLASSGNLDDALRSYSRRRKRQLRFYQTASRWLTPFFQSDNRFFPFLRNMSFGLFSRMPITRTQMLHTLAGLKTSPLTHMNPGRWHADYDLKKR